MIRLGTRSSRLALEQARNVREGLERDGHDVETRPTDALGDETHAVPVHQLGVAGAFTGRLEAALLAHEIDLAVHSLKDLPLDTARGLEVPAILDRGAPQDVLLVAPHAHDPHRRPPLERNARVATSGPRRQSQLLAARRDLAIVNVRGNVDTRIQKLRRGWFDALVTARAALDRMPLDRMPLDLSDVHVHDLDPHRHPPAPGQGAIAVQARAGSPAAKAANALDHEATRRAVETERALLGRLGGGCGLPLGAYADRDDGAWSLRATFAGTAGRPGTSPGSSERSPAGTRPGSPSRLTRPSATPRPRLDARDSRRCPSPRAPRSSSSPPAPPRAPGRACFANGATAACPSPRAPSRAPPQTVS